MTNTTKGNKAQAASKSKLKKPRYARTFCVNVNFEQTRKQQKRYRFAHQIRGGELAVLAFFPVGGPSMRAVGLNAWTSDREA